MYHRIIPNSIMPKSAFFNTLLSLPTSSYGVVRKPLVVVYRLAYNGDVVAFKMGRRQGGPSRTGSRGRISQSIRNRRATQPPVHFQRNPPGRGRLAVFPRCSLDPYESSYGRFTASPARTALKTANCPAATSPLYARRYTGDRIVRNRDFGDGAPSLFSVTFQSSSSSP